MPTVALYNTQGEIIGQVELSEAVFAAPVNEGLMHQAVQMQLANRRVGTAATKTRGMVQGGGRKPWRQKGTGRARQGSIRSPIWRGGGTVFGPQPREYGFTMPRKQRRAALRSALTSKVRSEDLLVVDRLDFDSPRTKEMAATLKRLQSPKKVLLVTEKADENVKLSARNIPGVTTIRAQDLNVYDVLNNSRLVITRSAVGVVEEVLGDGAGRSA